MKPQLVLATLCCASLSLLACEDKPAPSATAEPAAQSAAPPPAVTPSAPPAATSAPAASGAASPAGSTTGAAAPAGDPKEVVVTVKDPTAEPKKSVKVARGGSLTVYLPDYPGTVWSAKLVDKTLGKPKEETIPGFAPGGTNGHQFQWTMKNPLLQPSQTHQVTFENKKAGKPNGTFVLEVQIL